MGLLDTLFGAPSIRIEPTGLDSNDGNTRVLERSNDTPSRKHTTTDILNLLSAVSQSSNNLETTTNVALQKVCEYTNWPVGHAYFIEKNNNTFIAKSAKQWFIHCSISQAQISEFKQLSEATEFVPGKGLIGKVLESKKHTSADDVTTLKGYVRAEAARKNNIHGCFAFPIIDINNSSVRGILEFFSYEKAWIDDEILALSEFIGKQIAFTYANIDAQSQQKQLAKLFEERVSSSVSDMQDRVSGIAGITRDIENSITQIAQLGHDAKAIVDESMHELEESKDRAGELQTATREINEIASTINKIADQTNLLALNATIEAARAGDVGRGFAVVAEEVKALAQHTTESTSRVSNMVSNIGVVSNDIRTSLDGSKAASNKAIESVTHIENAVENQKIKTAELDNATDALLNQTENFAATVNQFLDEITN